jgi:hypothetical protein
MAGTWYISALRHQNHANYGPLWNMDGIVHTSIPDICPRPISNRFLKPLGRFWSWNTKNSHYKFTEISNTKNRYFGNDLSMWKYSLSNYVDNLSILQIQLN